MTIYTPSARFSQAASYLSSAPSLAKVSSMVKLELYGLFKYVTVSEFPSTARPSIFDMTGRAKWDAWNAACQIYTKREDAELRYLDMAKNLGWTEGGEPDHEPSNSENIWDDNDDQRASGSAGGGGGMGGSVSAMAPPPQEKDESIHGLAVSDNAVGLNTLLEKYPETDLNCLDEFGYTPLHLACDRGNLSLVKILLSRGADPTIKDPDGLSAFELAHIAGHDDIEAILSVPS